MWASAITRGSSAPWPVASTPTGWRCLHFIGQSTAPRNTNPWIRKYVFPGGYIPALSEVVSPVERSGLLTTDLEVLRLHYAKTLRHWRRRFAANRDTIAALYDDRFCRMFEFVAEIGFRRRHQVVFQLQLAHRQTAVPLTRDYMIDTGGQFLQTERPLLPADGRANSNGVQAHKPPPFRRLH